VKSACGRKVDRRGVRNLSATIFRAYIRARRMVGIADDGVAMSWHEVEKSLNSVLSCAPKSSFLCGATRKSLVEGIPFVRNALRSDETW